MKHCPACNFSFPDFHLVCDFDGTELVPDPQRLALIRFQPRRKFIRRFLTSPKTVTALAILGLFFIAAFIAFQQTTSRSTRTLLAVAPRASALRTPAVAASSSSPAAPTARTTRSTDVRLSSPRRSLIAGNHHEKRHEHSSRKTEVARRRLQPKAEKQPRFLAALKTTWRALKRPFSF